MPHIWLQSRKGEAEKPRVLRYAGVEQGELGERAWQWVGNRGRRGRARQHPDQCGEERAKEGWSNSRKWCPQGPPLLKEPRGLLGESDCVGELTPQFKGKAGDSLRQKEKGNLWALAAVGTGAAGWGTGGEESLA